MPNQNLSVDVLITDGGTQSRVSISEETVDDYTEVLESNGRAWPFPPIVVFHDGHQYLVADGFHRVLAARRAKRGDIPCEIRTGTAQDALRFGMTANDIHGLRRSSADKRNCVKLLLDAHQKLTRQEIADIAGVTERTVQRIVSERREGGVTLSPPNGRSRDGGNFDSFHEDADQLEEGWDLGRTDADGQDYQEQAPGPPRNGTNTSGGSSGSQPKDPFTIQKAKTIKTAEALSRAISDLNELHKFRQHDAMVKAVRKMIEAVKACE